MTQSLLAIATFVALIGGIIFGVKKFEEKSHSEDHTELIASTPKLIELPAFTDDEPELPTVEQPIGEAIEVISEPTPETATNNEGAFQSPAIADPWNETDPSIPEAESTQTVLDLGEISQADAPSEPVEVPSSSEVTPTDPPAQLGLELETPEVEIPIEAVSIAAQPEDPIEAATIDGTKEEPAIVAEFESSQPDVIEPRHEAAEIIIPATIHDPKRPNSEAWENLTQEILAWGQTKDLKYIPKLVAHAAHPDSIVRTDVAIALGQLAANHPIRAEVEQLIPVLGKLSQDSNLQVRQFAVQALGSIRSQKVLPYLQQALLSPSGSVMKAANDALQNLKLHYGQSPAMQIAQQRLNKTPTKA